ncbi:hypothetical protein EDD16DRAFT_1810360 [Pisolithus croceorrhizus]|nr:hypothetical protein EDD16DRAFT_1810360 [Pisolithus croceorrhizus]KAI6165682.1 hypothetical protein EDD17DRAFT_1505711 [Pisolithus thermaeus]
MYAQKRWAFASSLPHTLMYFVEQSSMNSGHQCSRQGHARKSSQIHMDIVWGHTQLTSEGQAIIRTSQNHSVNIPWTCSYLYSMHLGDFCAHVVVEDEGLDEYEVTINSSGTQATCWIGSEAGKVFKCLTNVQDDEALLGKSVSNNLGEITLCIVHGTLCWEHRVVWGTGPQLASPTNTYHEKSMKKLTTHCVKFGSGQKYNLNPMTWKVMPNQDPPLKFIFKYRPIGILQANGIAPQPMPTIPTTLSDNISSAQKTQSGVLERIALLENELKHLHSEVCDKVEDQKPKHIKRECVENHLVIHGEIIDLT